MEPPSRHRAEVLDPDGLASEPSAISRAVLATLERFAPESSEAVVLLVDDEAIAALNSKHRKVEGATDVLSFPAPPSAFLAPPRFIGDVAISVETARTQAKERGVPLDSELAYLAIHGTLHLLGFDDETVDGHRAMLEAMSQVGVDIGLEPDPDWRSLLSEAGGTR